MGIFVANKVVKLMIHKGITIKGAKALILGVTFKENCPDIRNSKVVDIYNELKQFGLDIDVYDPHVHSEEVLEEYKIEMTNKLDKYEAIILAVSHDEFLALDIKSLKKFDHSIIFDIKSILDRSIVDGRL
jgi:UDP-N-acetyl-D-galactosamine dehydrogenase